MEFCKHRILFYFVRESLYERGNGLLGEPDVIKPQTRVESPTGRVKKNLENTVIKFITSCKDLQRGFFGEN